MRIGLFKLPVFSVAASIVLASSGCSIASSRHFESAPHSTAIIHDNQAGVIRFMIDGKEAGRFTPDGLHMENGGIGFLDTPSEGAPAQPVTSEEEKPNR